MEQKKKVKSIYVYSALNGLTSKLRQALPNREIISYEGPLDFFFKISEEHLQEIRDYAVVLLTSPAITAQIVKGENKLEWFQSYTAGVELALNENELCPTDLQITRMPDAFEDSMAEYVIGHIISREKFFPEVMKAQDEKKWNRALFANTRPLSTLSVGILGSGRIGTHIAKLLRVFGTKLYGLCKHPRSNETETPFEKIWTTDGITEFLSRCDYLVNVLPSTGETKHLLSGDVLRACQKKQTYLINIGRGDVIDTSSIKRAIEEKWISGALLDTTEEEPLPPDSPLWTLPNVSITPHISGIPLVDKVVEVFVRNLHKYENNQPLENLVNRRLGY